MYLNLSYLNHYSNFWAFLNISISSYINLIFAPKFGGLSLVGDLRQWPKWCRPKATLGSSSAHDNPT